jgi:hypothetical protein
MWQYGASGFMGGNPVHHTINYPGNMAPLIQELSEPLDDRFRRDILREPLEGKEVTLFDGWFLDAGKFQGKRSLTAALDDWRQFMTVSMGVKLKRGAFPIRLIRGEPKGCPPAASEAHHIDITPSACVITARDAEGIRRALGWLKDEMRIRRSPVLPLGETARWAPVAMRITRSPIAPYRWLSGWELEDENDYYPEPYLARLSSCGVNGIWVAGLLRNLVASRTIPELGPPAHRLDKLRGLIDKAGRHGIKVFFFCIEPRALPLNHPALKAHPEIGGASTDLYTTLCPSSPLVLDYIRETMRELFTHAPGLAGVINIFSGERPTTCWFDTTIAQRCDRCRVQPRADVQARTLDAFAEGIRAASPDAQLLAWTYIIDRTRETSPIAPMLDVMRQSRSDIAWLGNFEHGGIKEILGKPATIHEYSLSYPGPSPDFRDLARAGVASGRPVFAKLQVGTTYELSAVPCIPVPGIVYDKFSALAGDGVTGAMLNWIPGGYPDLMLKAAGEAAFEPRRTRAAFLRRLAGICWGERNAEAVASAWERFGEAWQQYPFDNAVLYYGPITRAPAYQLHLERETRLAKPYNFGLDRNRALQPWEDQVARWIGHFTPEEVIQSFRDIAKHWLAGEAALQACLAGFGADPALTRQVAGAAAVRIHVLAAANVYEFYACRDRLLAAPESERPALLKRMQTAATENAALAGEMKKHMAADARLGFHSELYVYSYSPESLDEQNRQIGDLLQTLSNWEQTGIDPAVLQRTVEEAERLRPDRWGD